MAIQRVIENEYGVYVWELPSGGWFCNEEGEYLHISARFGDVTRMRILSKTAAHYGAPPGGKAKFVPGGRAISKMEWEHQMERLLDGKIPDDTEIGNAPGVV